jgi:hypothetical protein
MQGCGPHLYKHARLKHPVSIKLSPFIWVLVASSPVIVKQVLLPACSFFLNSQLPFEHFHSLTSGILLRVLFVIQTNINEMTEGLHTYSSYKSATKLLPCRQGELQSFGNGGDILVCKDM